MNRDKYTITEANESTFYIFEHEGNTGIECTTHFFADIVCRLLNEDDARKSLPKIDKIHKSEIIIFLINCAEIQNSIKYLKSAKIIDALEIDENGK